MPEKQEKITGYQDVKLRFTPQELDEALERIEEQRRSALFGNFMDTVMNNAANLELEAVLCPENIPKPRAK